MSLAYNGYWKDYPEDEIYVTARIVKPQYGSYERLVISTVGRVVREDGYVSVRYRGFNNRLCLGDYALVFARDAKKRETKYWGGKRPSYHDVIFDLEEHDLANMHRTAKTVNRRMDKMDEKYGGVEDIPNLALRFAQAIKAQGFATVSNSPAGLASDLTVWMTSEIPFKVRQLMYENYHRENIPVEEVRAYMR